MTKEQIIDNLKYQNEKFFGGQSETLTEAVKVLEQQSYGCITREQAIQKAKEQYSEIWDCDINHPKYEDTVEEIVRGVIRLIMQPTSDDCVSRQAVTDAVENTIAEYIPTFIGLYEKIPLELARAIKDVPPVTPTRNKPKEDITEDEVRINMLERLEERKVGKWVEVLGGCKCPFCDMAFSRLKEDCSDNFCPECGADMRGENNNG